MSNRSERVLWERYRRKPSGFALHVLCSGRALAVRFCIENSAEEPGGLRRHR